MANHATALKTPSPDPLTEALSRLNSALESLDSAVDESIKSRNKVHNTDEQVQRMADDRAKLAKELDASQARSERLAQTNSEVSRRLVGAMEMVRKVLDNRT